MTVKKGDWTRDQARPSPSEALLPPFKDGKIQVATLDDPVLAAAGDFLRPRVLFVVLGVIR
jgi:hypothetical protein